MPVLVNRSTGFAENLSDQQAQQAIANDTHDIPLNDEQGNPVLAPHSEALDLISKGHSQPTSEQLKSLLSYSKFSSTPEQLKTLAEGAASGATFGASTGAERIFGVNPEDITQRREVNPGMHAAGEMLGLVGSSIAGTGEGALLMKAGEKIIPKAAETFAGKVGTAAAKASIENMMFQSGDEVSKMLASDPNQSAETAISDIGLSGVLGAGLGAGFGSASELWKLGPGKKIETILQAIDKRSTGVPQEIKTTPFLHEEVPAEEFHNKIQEVISNPNPLYKANIAPYSAEDYSKFKTFLSPDRKSGYAVKPDGELISVFSLEKGRGENLVDDAVLNKGANKLDAFDINGKLPSLYGKYMDETQRLSFADEFAPADWNYESLGRPDVVMMKLNPKKAAMHTNIPFSVPPELKAALADNPEAQRAFQVLQESNTYSGKKAQTALAEFKTNLNESLKSILGTGPEEALSVSEYDTGKTIKETLTKALKEKIAPISEKYKQFEDDFKSILISPEIKAEIANNISEAATEAGYHKAASDVQMNMVNKVLQKLPMQETVEDLKKFITNLSDDAPFGSDKYQVGKMLRGILSDAQSTMIDDSVAALGNPEILSQYAATKAEYKQFKGLIEDLNDRLHVGKSHGPESFIKNINEAQAEDILKRLSPKGDVALQNLVTQQFPEVSQILQKEEINKIIKKSIGPSGDIDFAKFFKNVEKLQQQSPEFAEYSLGHVMPKLQALKEIASRIPSKMNTSGTARTLDALWNEIPASAIGMASMLMGHSGILGYVAGKLATLIGKEVPDAVRLSMLKFLGSNQPISAEGIKGATALASAMLKGETKLNKATEAVFTSGKNVISEPSANSIDKLKSQVDMALENPDKLMNAGGAIGHYMPEHGSSVAASTARNLTYLASLRPQLDPMAPLDAQRVASTTQESDYNNALKIAESPLLVLNKVKDGELTLQDLMHFKTMYPALYARTNEKLTHQMITAISEKRNIPYSTKLSLGLFTGQALDSSMKPVNIQANQKLPNLQQPSQGQQAQKNIRVTNKLDRLPAMTGTVNQSRSLDRSTGRH